MAVNMKDLKSNDFWKKKFRNAMEVRDIDGDGIITVLDFKLILLRYKDMGASDEHLEKLDKALTKMYQAGGIVDDSVSLTYEQFGANFAKSLQEGQDLASVFTTQFEIIDCDGNGEISFKEWVDYYRAVGINTLYARESFDAMDLNGDGIVSQEEFIAYLKEFYFSVEDKLKSSILYGPLDWTLMWNRQFCHLYGHGYPLVSSAAIVIMLPLLLMCKGQDII